MILNFNIWFSILHSYILYNYIEHYILHYYLSILNYLVNNTIAKISQDKRNNKSSTIIKKLKLNKYYLSASL